MKIAPFELERYFAEHEFSARHLLSCSDCEPLALSELTGSADDETGRMWNELKLSYTETWGHPLLRETVAEIYAGIGAQNVLVAAPEELVFLAMHALLNPGDHAICTFPGYQSLYEVARSIGCEVSFWEAEERRGWAFDPERLESLVRKDTKLIVVNFPHNPTGFVPSRESFEKIARIAKERGIFLFSDEMYRFLEIDDEKTLPSACELYDDALSLFGLSKTFGLPGLRIGWLVGRNRDLLERVCLLKDYTTICNGAPSEILAVMALRNRKRIVEAQRNRLWTLFSLRPFGRRLVPARVSFPRFTWECMPGRFASACSQAAAESRTNRLERRRGREASKRHSHVKRGNEAKRGECRGRHETGVFPTCSLTKAIRAL